MRKSIHFIAGKNGAHTAAIIPIPMYRQLLKKLGQIDRLRALDKALAAAKKPK